jgi:hypothetical protein
VTDPLVIAVVGCHECPFNTRDDFPACFADDTHRDLPLSLDRPAWCPLDVRPVLVRIAAPRPDVDDSAAGVRFSLLEME